MTAAVKKKNKFCLFVRREIDDYGLDAQEFCLYAQITGCAGNGQVWESLANIASACRMALSRARKTLRLLKLAEITH